MASHDQLYPYLLEPKITQALWGGSALAQRYGQPADPAQKSGESWECWDANAVTNGVLAGATLAELREQLGSDLMGPIDAHAPFPVLTKIIDANDALSVQVHPDDAYAQRVEHQPNGKTECWYVLDAAPGAEIVLGWNRDTDRAEYERSVADGTLGDLLRRVPARAGDVFFLPAGTLHAIGAGIQLFETQQASDLTYRIFDWNRVGADGKPRELHVSKAADVLDFRATMPNATRQLSFSTGALERNILVGDARFLVEHIRVPAGGATLATDGRPVAVMATDSSAQLIAGAGLAEVPPWRTAIVPAASSTFSIAPGRGALSLIVVRPNPDLDAVHMAATAAGIDPRASQAFFSQFP